MGPLFLFLGGLVGIAAGGIAGLSGFGIGSLLTPLLAVRAGTKLAVAAVAIPHVAGTALRFWLLRKAIDRRVLWSFGLTSAAGGLLGALLYRYAASRALTFVFACLLIFAGVLGLTGLAQRLRFTGAAAWVAGALSGVFGGLVGNQGGIRSAAMLGVGLPRDAFIATATAITLMVDGARLPVYLWTQGRELAGIWPAIAVLTLGVLVGTLGGARLLRRIPEPVFRRIVAGLILALGLFMLFRACSAGS
ncbi:MAG: sulfite exporter TauE/SafE family protein [Candidatus Brocadiia bacterium]